MRVGFQNSAAAVDLRALGSAAPAALRPRLLPPAGGGFAVSGERKQVSVLFADMVGSMLLAERLDPERLRAVMAELTHG
jgi:class 3 adenylate cyclase